MKMSDFNTLRGDLQLAVNGKDFTECLYSKVYRLQENKQDNAKAIVIKMSNDSMTVEYYNLYDLQPNKFGGKSYKDSKTVKTDYYRLSAKQHKNIAELFLSLYKLNEYYK